MGLVTYVADRLNLPTTVCILNRSHLSARGRLTSQYLLLHQRYVRQDEQTIFPPAQQLSEDKDLCNKSFPAAGGERVDQILPRLNAVQVQARLLPI